MARELRGALACLYACRDPEVLLEGRAGTAKTTGTLTKLIGDCERYPGCRVLICRRTRKSLSESVMVTFDRDLVKPGHPAWRDVQRINRHSNDWPNGSSIVWGGLDNPEGLFSTEWDRVYVAEATEVELEAWDLFGRAMRSNRTPYHQRIADCNPGPPGHWLNQRATAAGDLIRDAWRDRDSYNHTLQSFNHHQEVRQMRRLISVHPDNPGYWDLQTWDWTGMGKEYVMGTLAGMTGHRRARMFDGRWKAAEGSVYPEFDADYHVIEPFDVPRDWPCFIGEDPGYDHPTAILLLTVGPNGRIYVAGEIFRREASVETDAKDITRLFGGRNVVGKWGDPHYMFSSFKASSGRTIADQMRDYGHHFMPWPAASNKAQEAAQVESVRRLLIQRIAGKPALQVFRTCANTVREFQSWNYKRTASGELPAGGDEFEDRNNDAMDVIKGLVAVGMKWEAERAIEVAEGLQVQVEQ